MGLFDSIRATLACHVCGSSTEREIQTKKGPWFMLNLKVGDTIEPFFYGDYWIEEGWYCENCQQRMPEDERWQHPQTAFIHCVNGLIVEVTSIKPPERKMPDWPFIHQLSRDRLRYREALSRIRNSVLGFRRREERKAEKQSSLIDIGPKTVDELLDEIVDAVERAQRGEPVGLF